MKTHRVLECLVLIGVVLFTCCVVKRGTGEILEPGYPPDTYRKLTPRYVSNIIGRVPFGIWFVSDTMGNMPFSYEVFHGSQENISPRVKNHRHFHDESVAVKVIDLIGLEDNPDVIPPRDPYDVIGKDDHPDVLPPHTIFHVQFNKIRNTSKNTTAGGT